LIFIGTGGANAQAVPVAGIDGLYNATQGTGSDIGAKINNLCSTYSSFNPTIEVPSGTYPFTTPLNSGGVRCTIVGMGKSSTILQYMGSGVAEEGYNLHDLQLVGSGSGTGILLNSPLLIIDNVILGNQTNPFATAMLAGSNAYLDRVSNSDFSYNTQHFYFPGSETPHNSGENVVFDHDVFSNAGTYANCVQIGDIGWDGPQVTFYSPSFDSCQWANYDSAVTMYAPHLEAITPVSGPYGVTSADFFGGYPTNSTTLYNPQLFANLPMATDGLFEVDRYGVLNIDGIVDRDLQGPLVYLNTGGGGQPTLQVIAPDNQRTASLLYAVASGTAPHLMILTSAVLNLNAPNGLVLNGVQILPGSLTGTHGGGTKLQTSDSSGPGGDLPVYRPDGSLTDSGYGPTSYPKKTGAASWPHVACWLDGGTLGECRTRPDGNGNCLCQ